MIKIIILLLILFFSGCNNYTIDVIEFNSVEDIFSWVSENIEYSTVDEKNWKTPEEIMETTSGDCEDFVILAMYLLKRDLNINSEFVGGYSEEKECYHAWIEFDNEWHEIRNILFGDTNVTESYNNKFTKIYTYSYSFVMLSANIRSLK